MTHLTVAEIASRIDAGRVPAVFIDTCAALDVVRCAARGQPRVAGAARQFIDAGAAGELLLFAPSVLPKEAARNRVEVEADARRAARVVDAAVADHARVAGTVGRPYPHRAAYSHADLVGPLIDLHDQLLAACTYTSQDQAAAMAALARAGDNRRPARKGGGVNDCILLEEFLAIARGRTSGHPLVLLTTNTSDFGDKAGPDGVHADLAADLAPTGARIRLSWATAAATLLPPARLGLI